MSGHSGTARYVLAAVTALTGLGIAAGLIVWLVFGQPDPVRFIGPGTTALQVDHPGPYVIWHEHRTLFEGRSYDSPAALPAGVELRVTNPAGRSSPVTASSGGSWSTGVTERASVAEFEASIPGRYSIAAQGKFEPRVFAVHPSMLKKVWITFAGAMAAAVIGVGAGLAIGLHAFLRHTSPPAAPATASPVPTDDAERRLRQLVGVVYGLQAAALVVGITLLAGVIVNYLRREEASGSWLESHFRWQIRTFWWSLLWGVVGFATALVGVGILILIALTVWFLYRIVHGWTRLNDGLAM